MSFSQTNTHGTNKNTQDHEVQSENVWEGHSGQREALRVENKGCHFTQTTSYKHLKDWWGEEGGGREGERGERRDGGNEKGDGKRERKRGRRREEDLERREKRRGRERESNRERTGERLEERERKQERKRAKREWELGEEKAKPTLVSNFFHRFLYHYGNSVLRSCTACS